MLPFLCYIVLSWRNFFLHSHSYLLWETFHRHFYDKSPTKQFYNLCSAGFLPIISMKNCYVFFLYPISFLQIESQTSLLYWNHMMLSIYLSLFAEKNESIVLIFKTIKEVFSTVWSFSKLNSVFLLLYIIGYFFDMFY